MAERSSAGAVQMRRSCPQDPVEKPLTQKVRGQKIYYHISGFFMPFFTYILISSNSGNYYFGHCENLSIRLAQHNSGKVGSTKARRPWTLHYYEEFHAKSEAYKREQFLKSFDGRKWLYEKEIFKRAD